MDQRFDVGQVAEERDVLHAQRDDGVVSVEEIADPHFVSCLDVGLDVGVAPQIGRSELRRRVNRPCRYVVHSRDRTAGVRDSSVSLMTATNQVATSLGSFITAVAYPSHVRRVELPTF